MRRWIFAAALGLIGAAPTDVIVVRDHAAVASCRPLGEVRGSSKLGGLWADTAYNRSIDQLKSRTQALGGTHVQIIDSASGYAGSRMIGTAFQCEKVDIDIVTPEPK